MRAPSKTKVEIPFTQTASQTSQRKQGLYRMNRNHGSIKRSSISNKGTVFYRCQQTSSPIKVLFWTAILTNFAVIASGCPSECTCSVEATAFCNNKELNTTPLRFATDIEKLYLFNNNITTISQWTLKPLKNLKLLDLSGNRITNYALWNGVFNELNLLENLMLQENQITRIEKDMFKGLTNLARIYLQDNQISTIEEGAFDNLPNLVELKLKNNVLESFPRLQNTPSLLLLDLGFNTLNTIKDLAFSTVNLEHLKLQGNRLTQLRTSVFDDTSRLTYLDISDNRLTAVPLVIKSLTSLHFLNMSKNQVGSIAHDTFRGMNRLKVLDLHGMGLKSLPFGIVPPRVILNVWDITDNPWDCGCSSYWLPQYIRIFEGAFVRPSDIKCSGSSKLSGREMQDLTENDFECTDEEKEMKLLTTTKSTTTTRPLPTKQPWSPNPCEVYPCFNGGTCFISGRHPKCSCKRDWAGAQCQQSLNAARPPRTKATRITTIRMPGTKPTAKPRLMINEKSITENSVEIILPQAKTELVVSVSEIGRNQKPKKLTIKPMAHPFTVLGLESGKSYNICIHLPLEKKGYLLAYTDTTDTLCGSVQTEGIRVINTPMMPTKIRVVPSPGVDAEDEELTEKDKNYPMKRPGLYKPGTGGQLHDDDNVKASVTDSTDFKIIYPIVGAVIGAVIIIALLVVFFVCYRKRRMQKLENQDTRDYIPGSPLDPSQTVDIEMATVVHHHHHNHYNAGELEPNNKPSTKKQNGSRKKNNHQNKHINNNSTPKSGTTNKASSLGGNSNSSNSATSHIRHAEPQQRFMGHQYMVPTPPVPPYERMLPQIDGHGNEYVFHSHQNSNPNAMPMLSSLGNPVGRPYGPELHNDMQPPGQEHYPLLPGEGRMYTEAYPISPHNEYLTPATHMLPSYPQGNSRSAFQPIQSPRKNSVRTPTSESGLITTHVNTAHVLPTSTCLNRNVMSEDMMRYQDGVPVV